MPSESYDLPPTPFKDLVHQQSLNSRSSPLLPLTVTPARAQASQASWEHLKFKPQQSFPCREACSLWCGPCPGQIVPCPGQIVPAQGRDSILRFTDPPEVYFTDLLGVSNLIKLAININHHILLCSPCST